MSANNTQYEIFDLEQHQEIKNYFAENGFVVIKDILTPEECRQTYREMGELMTEIEPGFNLDDIQTWNLAPVHQNYGILSDNPIFKPQFVRNRINHRLLTAASIIYDLPIPDLLVNHDRCCFYRPSVLEEQKHWQTKYTYPGLHLDFGKNMYSEQTIVKQKREQIGYSNPRDFIGENNMYVRDDGLQIQGIINILNNSDEDGGFQCVPGFHLKFDEWCARSVPDTEIGRYDFKSEYQNDMAYVSSPIKISLPRGAIILWNQRMAHGSVPNNSSRPRVCQFFKVYPRQVFSSARLAKRWTLTQKCIPVELLTKLSNLEQQVLGKPKNI
jgi:ectoine hydroxylase-related dioxygenase (phytanoyl-CoA dioxygenase family)